MKGTKKLVTSTKTKRTRIYAEVQEPQPVVSIQENAIHYQSESFIVFKDISTGHLNETRATYLCKYNEWRYIPDGKFARELFALLYVTPTKGVAPSKRKRDLYRMFRKSLQIMWYQSQNAPALAKAS